MATERRLGKVAQAKTCPSTIDHYNFLNNFIECVCFGYDRIEHKQHRGTRTRLIYCYKRASMIFIDNSIQENDNKNNTATYDEANKTTVNPYHSSYCDYEQLNEMKREAKHFFPFLCWQLLLYRVELLLYTNGSLTQIVCLFIRYGPCLVDVFVLFIMIF